jgi:hypothetical protein
MSRHGDWCQTFSGRKFYPLDPRPEEIFPEDLAHGLAMTCRFGGQSKRFYSVAEHCVRVSELIDPRFAREGLLHDAAEAFIGDMIRPLKHQPEMVEFRKAESVIEIAVRVRFGLKQTPECWTAVKEADNRILVDEIGELMRVPSAYWERHENVRGFGASIQGWDPALSETLFLERFFELFPEWTR